MSLLLVGCGTSGHSPIDAAAPDAGPHAANDLALNVLMAGDGGDSADGGQPAKPSAIWVASWADAPDGLAGPASSEQTFRELVKPTVGSRGAVRLHFSNYFGTSPVTLGAVHVGLQTTKAGTSGDVAVTFNGASSVTIPAGAYVTSDNVGFTFKYGDVLAVTEYVSGTWTSLTAHAQGVNVVTNYATAAKAGNKTADSAGTSFTQTTFETYLLDRVDVYGDYKETIATFGSSTTDGYMSGLDAHMTYPEQLAAALHAAGHDDIAIANVGIAGTIVLGSGATAGINRFKRDVLGLPNVTAVIDYLGANDLRVNCVQADTLIAGKANLIAQAHAGGLKSYLAVTAPSTFCSVQNPSGFGTRFAQGSGEDAQRFLVNAWDKSTADSTVNGVTEHAPGADAIIDFNAAIVDPTNTSYMLPQYDSGDDIHPNAAGYGLMVKAIPLNLF